MPACIARFAICTGAWPSTIGSVSHLHLLAEHRELLHRGRPPRVERSHQHLAAVALGEPLGELGGGGGFAGALQADHHDGDRGGRVEIDRLGVGAERRDQLVVDDLDHHLAGRDRLDDLDADGALLDLLAERARHIECHVGLEQRAPNLAQRRVDVLLRKRAAPRQTVEDAAKPFRETVEHRTQTPLRPRAHRAVGRLPPASRTGRRGLICNSFESGRTIGGTPPTVNSIGDGASIPQRRQIDAEAYAIPHK